MKIEIRDRWVAALRSGEYEQGRSMLLDNEGRYCGLGVLCDTLGQDVIPYGEDDNHTELYELLGDLLSLGPVMRLNDNGATFPQVADWIEENVPVEATESDDRASADGGS